MKPADHSPRDPAQSAAHAPEDSSKRRRRDVAAGQEGDRIDTEMSNIHDDFGKGRAKNDGRKTARDVAEREDEKDR